MADGKVKIDVDLDSKKFEEGVDEMKDKMKEGAEGIDQNTDEIAKNLSGKLSAALSAVAVASGKMATDYNSALTSVAQKTGAAGEELENLDSVMTSLYQEGFGDSFEDVADAISQVRVQMKGLNSEELEEVTKQAIAFRDTFGTEITENVRVASDLMDNFGLSSNEAFDLMVKGMQDGLDFSGELIDTLKEYSPQFKAVGLDAEDMFSIFEKGKENGAWNLDKIGDAVKEFGIRVKDGSNTTAEGFAAIGLNADIMGEKFAKGGESARAAFVETVKALKDVDDPLQQNIAGVNLFGTMWEDLGAEAVLAMTDIEDSSYDASDAMDKLLEKRQSDSANTLRELKNNTEILGKELGQQLLPAFNKIVKGATKGLQAYEELDEGTKELISTTAGIATVSIPAVYAIQKIGKAYSSIKEQIGVLENAVMNSDKLKNVSTKLFDVLKANPYIAVAAAAAGLGVAIKNIVDSMHEEYNAAIEAGKARESLISEANAQNQSLDLQYKRIKNLAEIEDKSAGQKALLKQYVNELNESVEGLNLTYDEENDKLNMTTDALREKIEAQKESALADAYLEKSKEALDDYVEKQVEQAEKQEQLAEKQEKLNKLRSKGSQLTNAEATEMRDLSTEIGSLEQDIDDLTDSQYEYLKESARATNEITKQSGAFEDLLEQAGITGEQLPQELVKGIDSGKYQIPQSVDELNSYITFTKAVEKAGLSGSDIVKQLSAKLLTGEITIDQAIQQLNSSAGSELNKMSTTGKKAGQNTSKSVAQGMKEFQTSVSNMSKSIMQNAKKSAEKVKYESIGENAVYGIWSGMDGLDVWLRAKVAGFVVKNIADAAAAELEINSPSKVMARRVGYAVPEGIALGIEKKKGVAVKAVEDTVNDMVDVASVFQQADMIPSKASFSVKGSSGQVVNNNQVVQNFYNKQTTPYEAYRKAGAAFAY